MEMLILRIQRTEILNTHCGQRTREFQAVNTAELGQTKAKSGPLWNTSEYKI